MPHPMLTPELCGAAVANYVTPVVEANLASGKFGRREGWLVVIDASVDATSFKGPDDPDLREAVIFEHTWGEDRAACLEQFGRKALEKAYGAWLYEEDYGLVLNRGPEATEGLIQYPGAVYRDVSPNQVLESHVEPVSIGYAGLWWWNDRFLAEASAAGIQSEMERRIHEPPR